MSEGEITEMPKKQGLFGPVVLLYTSLCALVLYKLVDIGSKLTLTILMRAEQYKLQKPHRAITTLNDRGQMVVAFCYRPVEYWGWENKTFLCDFDMTSNNKL